MPLSSKTKWKRFRALMLALFFVAAIYLASCFIRQEQILRIQKEQLLTLGNELTALQEENAYLEEEIAYMDTDAYVERIAREKLDMVRKNEVVYMEKE